MFEFNIGLEHTSELEKSFIMGSRGQYVREIINQSPIDLGSVGSAVDRRAGFWIDGGAGSWRQTLAFETGLEDVEWGDESGGRGASNVTDRDASGADVPPLVRQNVLDLWLARSITDSRNPGWLFFGEWTSSDQTLRVSTPDGEMGGPMPVAIVSHTLSTDIDRPGSLDGQVQVERLTPFAAVDPPGWLGDSAITDILAEFSESLGVISDA